METYSDPSCSHECTACVCVCDIEDVKNVVSVQEYML